MRDKKQGIILFSIVVIYQAVWRIFYSIVPSNLNFVLWGIWIALVIFFIYWLSKKTDFFKKQDSMKSRAEHRMEVLEQMGFYSIMVPLLFVSGFISIGMGVLFLFSNRPDSFDGFLGMTILGLIVIIIALFSNNYRKKKKILF